MDSKYAGNPRHRLNYSPFIMLLSAVLLALASYVYRDALLALASPGTTILDSSQALDIVDTGYARYLGNRSFPNTVAFLGVPYAEPPLGDRRFRAPLPLDKARVTREANGKVVDVSKNPAFCIQGTTGGQCTSISLTQILVLNVFYRR